MNSRVRVGKSDGAGAAVARSSGAAAARVAPAATSVPKRRKRSKGNIFAAVVAFLTLVGLIAAPFWLIKAGATVRTYQADNNFARAYHIGDAVSDGTVSFVVRSVHCGQTEVGTLRPTQGQFCKVDLAVRNNGQAPARFNAISQRAMGSRGGFYLPDPAADAMVNGASDTVPDAADPKNTAEATLSPPVAPALRSGQLGLYSIIYDIPANVTLTRIDLHATEYSRGAQVLFKR